jgi:hypothetical protein
MIRTHQGVIVHDAPSLKVDLDEVYKEALLSGYTLTAVAKVIHHVDVLLDSGRLAFPEGAADCTFADLLGMLLELEVDRVAKAVWE